MSALLERGHDCQTTGVDKFPLGSNVKLSRFIKHDLNAGIPDVNISEYDYVLLLDVIEHLTSPEVFFDRLRDAMKHCTETKLIISTPNVGFFIIRLMLLLGQFLIKAVAIFVMYPGETVEEITMCLLATACVSIAVRRLERIV